jgi:hypothetical protein
MPASNTVYSVELLQLLSPSASLYDAAKAAGAEAPNRLCTHLADRFAG